MIKDEHAQPGSIGRRHFLRALGAGAVAAGVRSETG
jgi:hypothetical protein